MIDLSTLVSGPTGEQLHTGWPGPWKFNGLTVVIDVINEKTGEKRFLDPVNVSKGEAEVHEHLYAFSGVISDKASLMRAAFDEWRQTRLNLLNRLLDAVGSVLPGMGSRIANDLVAAFMRVIL